MCTPMTIHKLMRWKLRRKASSNLWSCCSVPLPPLDEDRPTTTTQNSFAHLFPESPRIYKLKEEEEQEEEQYQQEREEEEEEDVRIQDESNPELCSSNRCSSMFIERFETELPESETEPHSPPLAEGDYIVFCFKEDGEFDIVKEKISRDFDIIDDTTIVRLRPINRKLMYEEESNINDKYREDQNMLSEHGVDFDPRNEWGSNICDEKGEDGDSVYFDPESPARVGDLCDGNEDVTASVESSGSTNPSEMSSANQSDGSASSFAFPVLNKEWTGSPIKMPELKSAMHLRRHRDRKLRIHCCKF